jgi:hypothetical protein
VKQRGNSTLGMVLMMLLMGGLTLHATRTQLSQGMVLVADEQLHSQDFWQAQAALTWGRVQNWPQATGWQCQQWTAEQWQSCLLRMEDDNALLSGHGEGRALWLYRWVSISNTQPQPQEHGWIDYCPLSQPALCQPEAAGL